MGTVEDGRLLFVHGGVREKTLALDDESSERSWGVQILVQNPSQRIFLRHDEDGGKTEGHVLGGKVVYPNTRTRRFNSSSGGGSFREDPIAVAVTELREELDGHYMGSGLMRFHANCPVFSCYQEVGEHAYILGGLLVTYHVDGVEEVRLREIGKFWRMDTLNKHLSHDQTDVFRPAFRFGLIALQLQHDPAALRQVTAQYNEQMLNAAAVRAQNNRLMLHAGVFSDYFK